MTPLRFVNGGGTGSLASTASEDAVTELAAGSGFYAPALFDSYSHFSLAAGRRLRPADRAPPGAGRGDGARWRLRRLRSARTATASRCRGSPRASTSTATRAPARCRRRCSARPPLRLRIGDRVYMRHAKAGELCERFDRLYLVEGDAIVAEAPTYRGEGLTYL